MVKVKRREFIKLAAVTSGLLAASKYGYTPVFLKKKEEKIIEELASEKGFEVRYFTCGICGAGCVLKGFVDKNGKLVKIEGDSKDWVSHGTPCVKGKSSLRMLYDPNRLKKPLKRTNPERGFVVNADGTIVEMKDPRWVEVSWDEALNEIADKMAEAIKEWGPQSIVFIGHGKGGALANLIGTPNLVKHPSTCHSTQDVTLMPMFGGLPDADMEHSRMIISFGFDQGAGKSKNPFSWLFAAAKRNGAKIIVFEPRLSETANKATEWIPIKPGTDSAVALAMANVIISEKLYDEKFLLKYTNAPILVDAETLKYVKDKDGKLLVYDEAKGTIVPLDAASRPALEYRGDYEGKRVATSFTLIKERVSEYTPEFAEKVSGVPASKIREIAREFATTKPAAIPHWKRSGGTGPSRQQGVETYKAIALLMTLTGNIEVRGGWIFNRTAAFATGAVSMVPKKKFSDLYPIPDKYKGKTIDERERFPVYDKYQKAGAYQKVWYNILNDNPYPVKVLVVWAQGFQAFMDNELITAAMNHVVRDNKGIVVNVNIYPDEMATLADIVLPENLFFEGGPRIGSTAAAGFDITYRINWIDGLNPVYPDVKSELWITKQLAYKIAERLGISKGTLEREYFSEYFTLTPTERLQKILDAYNKKLGTNVTLEQLEKDKVFSVPWKPADLTKLNTPSGRIEILSSVLADYGYDPLPAWRDYFTYQGPLGEGELLVVTSVFSQNRHSKTVNMDWLRYFLAKWFADMVWIHPETAKSLGVREGDYVVIEYAKPFNPNIVVAKPEQLKLRARVHVTEAVRPDVVFIPHGTGQISQFMASYMFGTSGGDGIVKPVLVDYRNPSAASSDQDFVARVRRYA